jgi:hypothetical protein
MFLFLSIKMVIFFTLFFSGLGGVCNGCWWFVKTQKIGARAGAGAVVRVMDDGEL